MKNLEKKLTGSTKESVAKRALDVLNGRVDIDQLDPASAKETLIDVLIYKEVLSEKFAVATDALISKVPEHLFNDVRDVDKVKVKFELKETVNAKALGMTNKELKDKYAIADAIISEDTKTIVTLHKDKLEEAINAQIPEVLDAITNGHLSFDKANTKTISVK